MHPLNRAFAHFVKQEKLFTRSQRLLVAVSGGLDSVVLCHLLKMGGFDFEIAHVNFQLRGDESERDAAFVIELANQMGVPFHITRQDTMAYAASNKCSVQVAARQLRYQWFEELIRSSGDTAKPLECLLTAHHANDNAETVLLNLFRGTGLQGMRGILPVRDKIRRPLLFAAREDLLDFAVKEKIIWVEDSSNISEKYARNFIRLSVIPLVQQQYPSLVGTLNDTAYHFRQVQSFYDHSMATVLRKLIVRKGNEQMVPIGRLRQLPGTEAVLFSWLNPFGFSSEQTRACLALLDSQTGHYIDGSGTNLESISFRLLKDRNWLVLSPLESQDNGIMLLEKDQGQLSLAGGRLEWETIPYTGQSIPADKNTAFLDAADIVYPLLLRKWKQGDYFYPMGMRKKKKLARFFIDARISRVEKERIRILESARKIIWLVGQRIDDRFKITPGTKTVLVMRFHETGV
ncbi:tRNA lysidine(34) synthetase TilS [Flavihumibacter stibioxidans]|uniref:tRNA(Ile)-lysidine synthase n=1 Tax=Flavihumibacter stibioxidans TaxID=1834163 RepID=A0ABR7MDU9_9BACT|nr:tRNA lysidine(34) synthetase TilS [Flavihumibacter stibioxidans]MBC6493132.1 tRNA lysidine(34) synthetase TilS [Flavihumibacter stibioxidans]